MKTINVIGCGNVGKTLARLWCEKKIVRVQSILNRSLASAARAVDFVGDGRAVERYAEMSAADVVMIATSDESIAECCRQACHADLVKEGTILFHCSGALPSNILKPAKERGAWIASIHPIKSFSDPSTAVKTFPGTFCAIEGDAEACAVLRMALHRSGATTFALDPESKSLYHAATVIVCNYLVALLEVGLRCFAKAGIGRDTAMEVMQPIVTETARNFFQLGPVRSLTGPIARAETSVVARQCEALGQWDQDVLRIYKALGLIAIELAAAQNSGKATDLEAIKGIIQE